MMMRPVSKMRVFTTRGFCRSALAWAKKQEPLASDNLAAQEPTHPRITEFYPFSNQVTAYGPTGHVCRRDNMRQVNQHLSQENPKAKEFALPFITKNKKERVRPGSIVTVGLGLIPAKGDPSTGVLDRNQKRPTQSFTGVLQAVRKRHEGRDTSIRLRGLVGSVGTELSLKLASPYITHVTIVERAKYGKEYEDALKSQGVSKTKGSNRVLRAADRAKLYYLRDQPHRFPDLSYFVSKMRKA